MIRHRPGGRGHAYLPSLDQRIPVHPVVGDRVEIRAVASDGVEPFVELEGRAPARMTQIASGASSRGDDGHLAAAAEAGENLEGHVAWTTHLEGLGTGRVRYRIVGGGQSTEWFDFTPAAWAPERGQLTVHGSTSRLVSDSIEWLMAGAEALQVRFELRLDPDQVVIGLGERFHELDLRGQILDTVVFEQYRSQGSRTYLPTPFGIVAGGDGWGFWVETSRRCWFDLGSTAEDVIRVTVGLGDRPEAGVHLWDGSPRQVLDRFLDATVRPRPVPDWALRPWMSGNEWNTQSRVVAEVRRSLDEDVPVGVVVVEAWSDEATFTAFRDAEYETHVDGAPHRLDDFTFPEDGAWPDPRGMVEWLHGQGVRVLLWQIPLLPDHDGVPQLDADRTTLIDRGYGVREADGAPYVNRGWWFPGAMLPDFTSREATDWWIAKRRYLLEDVGIDGFKTDGGEHAWGDELRYADGTRGDWSNNLFPNRYAEAYHRLIHECDADAITFSRAGFTGAGSFPAHWAGDERSTWEAFRASILAGQSAGVSGVFAWSWDLGGFSGEIPDPELYLRSAAMATFCPIMQYHSEFNHHRTPSRDRTPWNIGERHDAPEVIDIYRRFAKLRERLVPYLARELSDGIASATPLMRPVGFDHPDDGEAWAHPMQYLLGRSLLVAPVTEPGATAWEAYLPSGGWVDVWTGDLLGRGHHRVEVPLHRIPVFCRAGDWAEMSAVFSGEPDGAC